MLYVIGVVVDHIQDDADVCLVECLYHLLELTDAYLRAIRVSRIAAFRHIVVDRVVAPVVLWLVETCLVHRTVVV